MLFSNNELKKLIIPLVIEQLLAITIGMADTIMVASCGEAAVSGISLVDTINILLINIFSALATGGAIVASQYIGRDDSKNANKAAKQLIIATTLLAVIISIFSLVLKEPILNLIFGHTEASVMENCYVYFFWSALSYPFLSIYNAGAALFRAMGNSKISMAVSVLMNCLNLIGNAVLIFVFDMGVAGAAISTLFSRIVGAVIILYLLRYKENIIKLDSLVKWQLDFKMIKSILRVGIPNGLENGMFQFGKILLQSLIATFGTVAIAANAVGNSVAMISQVPGNAISLAMIPVVGQCVGAGEYGQAKHYMKKLTTIAYISMAGLHVLCIIFINPIVGLFGFSAETSALSAQLLIYASVVSIFLWPASFVLPNGLRAAGDVKFTMLTSIVCMWLFRIGFGYLLGQYFNLGVLGVWIAMTIDWFFRIIAFLIRIKSGKWKKRTV